MGLVFMAYVQYGQRLGPVPDATTNWKQEGWTLNGNVFVKGQDRMLPLYEAKMIHFFDHRYGTYQGQTEAQANMGTLPRLNPAQHDDPDFVIQATLLGPGVRHARQPTI